MSDYATILPENKINVVFRNNVKHYVPEFITTFKPYERGDINLQVLVVNGDNEVCDLVKLLFYEIYGKNDTKYHWPYTKTIGGISRVFEIRYNFDPSTISRININSENDFISSIHNQLDMNRFNVAVIIGNKKLITKEFHDKIKAALIGNRIRTQFVTFTTLKRLKNIEYKATIPLTIAVQLIAKAGGTPWIVDSSIYNDLSENASSNGMLMGIAFARPRKDKITYSVGYFTTLNNYYQRFDVQPINESIPINDNTEGLYVPKEAMIRTLESGIRWYKNIMGITPPLLIIFKTSPMHKDEKEAIEAVVGKDTKWVFIHAQYNTPVRLFGDKSSDYYVNRGTVIIKKRNRWNPNNGDYLHSEIIITATGKYKKPSTKNSSKWEEKYILGTPRPITLSVYSSFDVNPIGIAELTLSQIKADWEHPDIRSRKIAVLKYAKRMAGLVQYINSLGSIPSIDVRDVL
ncbi:argonaute/piwi family protein [Saccharolobus islandicus]|uniref:Stem cell self-renewal protein Piwi domain protein n=1 Tax=Saccharolobus islandicus (strain L.D.8.5 / Lassen \|nr:hypothetical protein [Sulfolobus islandicus]ADB87190.1 stem cell self-renewal protein Piwi domain protein [Sulfolobus islandicus L.D.8.5]